MAQYDAIVIGGGVSGLSAARKLMQDGKSVLVLEAKDRVGGRTLTVEHDNLKWDMGGQWVGPTQPHILALLKELGIETYNQHIEGMKIMETKAGEVKVYSDSGFGQLPLSIMEAGDLLRGVARIELTAMQLSTVNPVVAGRRFDDRTLAGLANDWCSKERVRDVIEILARICLGTEASLVSALYFLAYCRGSGGLMALCEAKNGGGQEWRIHGGAQQISQRLAAMLGEDRVRLNSPVAAINQAGDVVTVLTTTGESLTARTVICALPPHLTAAIAHTPAMPALKHFLYKSMPMGHMVKVALLYRTSFWRSRGLSGEAISSRGPVCYVVDACHGTGSQPALVAFVAGEDAIGWSQQPKATREQRVVAAVEAMFGPEARTELLAVLEKDWETEPWNGGCPVGTPAPGVMTVAGHELRTPHGRVLFAGTELGTVWHGFLNGAVQSGLRAAGEAETLLAGGAVVVETCSAPPALLQPKNAFGLLSVVVLAAAAGCAFWHYRKTL